MKLRNLYMGVFSLALLSSMAFAEIENCQNPFELTLDGDVKMKFCEIPAANGILIGSENGDNDEKPVKARDFEKSFFMGQFEVTQSQFKTLMGYEPWKNSGGSLKSYVKEGNSYPAVYVTYGEAVQFARILSFVDKEATYRLPTEAEWEYAARAGSTLEYYWGDDFDANFAYYRGNSNDIAEYAREVTSCPTPFLNERSPGYCANDFGLMHMAGNVWELTKDAYVDSYENAPANGHEAVSGSAGSNRVLRGGSWSSFAQYVRSAVRSYVGADFSGNGVVGFRLLRMPK